MKNGVRERVSFPVARNENGYSAVFRSVSAIMMAVDPNRRIHHSAARVVSQARAARFSKDTQ